MSFTIPLIGTLFMGIITLLVAASFFSRGDSYWVGGLFPLFLALIPFYSFAQYEHAAVRSGRFYDEHFVVVERRHVRDIRYDDVRKVESTYSYLAPTTRLKLYLEGREDPVVLISNARSRNLNLKIDLFSWIRKRIAGSDSV